MTSPRVFISYSHDSPEHKDAVLALSDRLRREGIDCTIDQYEQAPAEGWPFWCERQVERASFVLVICTETYLRRFRAEETPGRGRGGTWEGHIITQELYNSQGSNTKFIPITFSPEASAFIPLPLQSTQSYQLQRDYELLYRRLSAQPLISKPALGSVVAKAPRLLPQPTLERRQSFEPIWHMRHHRSHFFTGRDQVLTNLRQALETRGAAALSGLGGVGKTQTAIEYAYRFRDAYHAVFWVDADSRETLLASFASVAATLNLPSAQVKEQELAVRDVHRWLAANPNSLLILDNADNLPIIQEFLPNPPSAHLLLTTQAQAVASLAERIGVRTMPPEEGALLLLHRARVLPRDKTLADASEADRLAALNLSRELGGLPLALDQAGAFLEETQLSLPEYANLFASEKASLLSERGSLGDHPSVTVTFRLAFGKLAAASRAAADLLCLCAFLAPDAIPEEIFLSSPNTAVLGEHLGPATASKLTFYNLLREPTRYSF